MSRPCGMTLDHGVVGNGRVLALIAPSTHIDWLCMPRFDSASVFARILDIEKGGTFAFQPDCDVISTRMEYVVNTNVLRTEIACKNGRFDVYDYAPRIPAGLGVEAPVEIQRLVIPREGAARVRVLFEPKPDYARCQHPKIVPISGGWQIGDPQTAVYLRTNAPLSYLESGQPIRIDEPFFFALRYGDRARHRFGGVGAAPARSHHCRVACLGEVMCAAIVREFAGPSVGAVSQAARLHGHWSDYRGGDDEHSGSRRIGANLGLSLLLATGRCLRRRSAAPCRAPRRGRSVRVVSSRCRRSRPAPAVVRYRR